ncbi:MAG: DUF3810 domain-containing protein [Ruminococcaceae bacterium]|nr:DUF3810 domain-containing protein [Oscillospiraceae bacterium]
MIKNAYRAVCRFMPAFSFWGIVLAAVCGGLHLGFVFNPAFADVFNESVSAFFRALFSWMTVWIPFSLAEMLILSIPVIFAVLLTVCIRRARDGWLPALRCIFGMLSVIALIYVMFVLTFAAGYQATPLDRKLGISREKVSAQQLADTAVILAEETEKSLDEITFRPQSFSVMPYSYNELSRKLMDAYDRVCEKYPFIQKLYSRVKPINLSKPMTYTHISGVYTMFTGEANINVNYPDYVIPYTAAHELAHQRGIARENEANFVAFLVCQESDDPYIRYSGYLNMYEYVASALYSASPDLYYEVLSTLDMRLRYEMRAYSSFFDQYRENIVADVSEAVNNSYLVMQGTEGTKSYGMVVDLAVAYLLDDRKE